MSNDKVTAAPAPILSGEVAEEVKTWPERIYLQCENEHGDGVEPYKSASEITWCEDSVSKHDVKYVRADLAAVPAMPAQVQQPSIVAELHDRAVDLLEAVEGAHAPGRCKKLRAAIEAYEATPAQPIADVSAASDERDIGSLLEQSEAWTAVIDALNKVAPGWLNGEGTGIEMAVSAINGLAARTTPASGQAAQSQAVAADRIRVLEAALKFYADGEHFYLHDSTAWDTVSGEPDNFYEDESNTATVEDGSVAKAALAGAPLLDDEASATNPPAPPVRELTDADIEWSHDLQARLISGGQNITESEDARQVMAEAACLLASLTGQADKAEGASQ